MTIKVCSTCKHSRMNNGRDEWCHYNSGDGDESCIEHSHWELFVRVIPSSVEDCENRYPDAYRDIPEGTCEKCGRNKIGGECGHRPYQQKGSVIITAHRYYSPESRDGLQKFEPVVFKIPEEG